MKWKQKYQSDMDNNITINNKEKTWAISINWNTDISKEDKDKIYSISAKAIKMWEVDQAFTNAAKIELEKLNKISE